MLQSKINDMFSIKKELNVEKGCNGSHPSHHTIDGVIPRLDKECLRYKNPAYKSINSSQTTDGYIFSVKVTK